jgi:molybdopterin/thiamine biosynthesis adenylyltransferase
VTLSDDQIRRYSRHVLLAEVGGIGQERLLASRALVVGAGGLGCPAGLYLAAAGVGRIRIVDGDRVDLTNLQRQIAHGTGDVGRPKVASFAEALARIDPAVEVEAREGLIDPETAPAAIEGCDVVLDGSDNFATKFLANDAALRARRPLVHGGVLRTTLQLLTVAPAGLGGCLRCLFEAPPPDGSVPSCSEAGILGPVAGFAGGLMAAEALRLLAGERGAYEGRLYTYEARTARSRLVLVRKRAGCPACAGTQPLEPTAIAACETTSSRQGGPP